MRTIPQTGLLCIAVFAICGCASGRKLPSLDSIQSIHVSLSDPANPTYWNHQGFIAKKHWPNLLRHLSGIPYGQRIAKWQGLAVITIKPTTGDEFSIAVFDTLGPTGCYQHGGYLLIRNQNQFAEDVKRWLDENATSNIARRDACGA